MKKLLNDETEKEVIDMLNKGVKCTVISRTLDVPYNAVYYISTKLNCKRLHKYNDEEVEYLREYYGKISACKIAKKLNIPISSVYNKARHLGLYKFRRK